MTDRKSFDDFPTTEDYENYLVATFSSEELASQIAALHMHVRGMNAFVTTVMEDTDALEKESLARFEHAKKVYQYNAIGAGLWFLVGMFISFL